MHRTGTAILSLAALGLGTYQAYRPTFDTHFANMQVDPGDGLLNNYLLEHTWRAVSDRDYRGSLASPPFFYPTRNVLWYSETFLGAAPAYWALRPWLPPDLAFQWWQIAMSALNFAAMTWVGRRLGCNHLFAVLGGYLWAYGLVHLYLAMHQQLIPRFWMPPAVYWAWRFAQEPRVRSFCGMLGAAFLQCVTCVYTGWFLVVGLAAFVPLAIGMQPDGWRRTVRLLRTRRMGIALGGWAVVFGAYFAPYVVVNAGIARDAADYAESLPTVATWFAGPGSARWHDTVKPLLPADVRGHLFSGFGLYAIAAAAALTAYRARRPELALAAAALITAAIGVLLTLDFGDGRSAWTLVRFLPGGQAIRRVDRVGIVVYLFLTLAAIVWLQWAFDRVRGARLRWPAACLAVAALIYEQTGLVHASFPKAEYFAAADRYAAGLRGADVGYVIPRSPNVYLPYQLYGNLIGMWAGLEANVPVVNGYSGRYPDDYSLYDGDAEGELRAWLTGRFRGRVAIIDPLKPDEVRWLVIE